MKQQESNIYKTILNLPLFKGISPQRLHEIVGRYKLNFRKFAPEEGIISEGTPCETLNFILSGNVRLTTASPDKTFTVEQTLTAPQVISPDHLFGRSTVYPCMVSAVTTVGMLQIAKEEYRRMLVGDQIFLFNYLNTICSSSQRAAQGLLTLTRGNAVERIAYWILTLTQTGSQGICLTSTKTDLHIILGIQAAQWKQAIERLTEANIISEATPRSISVVSRSALETMLRT